MEEQEEPQEEIASTEAEPLTLIIGMLDLRALEKPVPDYPVLVEKAHLSGRTVVEVLVDQAGNVEHAAVISGHPVLYRAVLKAAYQAKFAPTFVRGQRVKLSGFLTYELNRV